MTSSKPAKTKQNKKQKQKKMDFQSLAQAPEGDWLKRVVFQPNLKYHMWVFHFLGNRCGSDF